MCLMKTNVGWGRFEEFLYLVVTTIKRAGYHDCYSHYFDTDCWQGITLTLGIDRRTVYAVSDTKLCYGAVVAHCRQ